MKNKTAEIVSKKIMPAIMENFFMHKNIEFGLLGSRRRCLKVPGITYKRGR